MKPRHWLLFLFLFVSHLSLYPSLTPHPYNTSTGACISAAHINFTVLMIVMWMPEAETEHNSNSKWLLPVGCSVSVLCACLCVSVFFPQFVLIACTLPWGTCVDGCSIFAGWMFVQFKGQLSVKCYIFIFFLNCCFFFFLTSCLGKRLKAASCASPWRAVLLNHSIGPLNTAFKPFNPTQHILRSCAQHFNSQFYLCLWVTTPINDTHAKYPAPCVYI